MLDVQEQIMPVGNFGLSFASTKRVWGAFFPQFCMDSLGLWGTLALVVLEQIRSVWHFGLSFAWTNKVCDEHWPQFFINKKGLWGTLASVLSVQSRSVRHTLASVLRGQLRSMRHTGLSFQWTDQFCEVLWPQFCMNKQGLWGTLAPALAGLAW